MGGGRLELGRGQTCPLCCFPRASWDEEPTAARPGATCPRKPALLPRVWGRARRNGPGDHVASSCSPGQSQGPCTEQLRMLLPLLNRKGPPHLLGPGTGEGGVGGRGKSSLPGFGVGGSGRGLPAQREFPPDQPWPSDRLNPHLPRARNKRCLFLGTCGKAPGSRRVRGGIKHRDVCFC